MANNTLQNQKELLKVGINRAANKLALPLETFLSRPAHAKNDDAYAELVRGMLNNGIGDDNVQTGMIEMLYNLARDLKFLGEKFFPEDDYKTWKEYEDCLSGILTSYSLVSLILNSNFEFKDFTKVSNRAILGLVEQLRDVYQRLVDISAELEAPEPKEAA